MDLFGIGILPNQATSYSESPVAVLRGLIRS
jgi:hypothetical protein